jgi:hypothetical protein
MNLDELAESQLGPGYDGARVRFDEICQDIGDLLGRTAPAVESMLGTLYWAMLFPRTVPSRLYEPRREVRGKVTDLFVSNGVPVPSESAEHIVVGHGQPTRYSLVLVRAARTPHRTHLGG